MAIAKVTDSGWITSWIREEDSQELARHKTTLAPFTRSPGQFEQLQTQQSGTWRESSQTACLVNDMEKRDHMGIIKEILNLKYLFRNTDNIQYVD